MFTEINNVENNKSKLSLCYVGGLGKEEFPEFLDNFKKLGDKCRNNKCHFHIYPNVHDEVAHSGYYEYENTNKYFHIHKPILAKDLIEEIAKYDYGVLPINKDSLKRNTYIYNTHEKVMYGVTNKFFDYIEAGLPIIAASPIEFSHFFEERGILLNWTIEDYEFNILYQKKQELKEKVLVERQKLKISNHIYELIDFYHSF